MSDGTPEYLRVDKSEDFASGKLNRVGEVPEQTYIVETSDHEGWLTQQQWYAFRKLFVEILWEYGTSRARAYLLEDQEPRRSLTMKATVLDSNDIEFRMRLIELTQRYAGAMVVTYSVADGHRYQFIDGRKTAGKQR